LWGDHDPAAFRESRLRKSPAIIVTASHNEPEWNGLKFLVNGRGIQNGELDRILEKKRLPSKEAGSGRMKRVERFSYDEDILRAHGEGSCKGVKVVLDINGGAAFRHTPSVLQRLGCEVTSLGDTPSFFSRTVDPTADDLELLRKMVVKRDAHIGLAFDCDGDRLVIVDNEGRKRSGDFMLTLALKQLLSKSPGESVVTSVDTTLAVQEVVNETGGKLYESKVGEANVLRVMTEKNSRFGGEGSSGGLIDASFNSCRDSMVAAVAIIKALKERGAKVYDQVKSYHQSRIKIELARAKAERVIKKLQKEFPDSDKTDGV
jgi:phosphomannomutase